MLNKKFMNICVAMSVFGVPTIASQPTTTEPQPTTPFQQMTAEEQAQEESKKRLAIPKTRQEILQGMKGDANLSDKDNKTLKANSKARGVEKFGGKIVSTTDKISGYLASSNFVTNAVSLASSLSPVSFPDPLAVAGLLVNVVGVVGQGIEAYGGYGLRNAGLIDIAFGKSADVSDLNEATKVLEDIEALDEMEQRLSGKKTIKRALEKEGSKKELEKEGAKVSMRKKLLIYMNPSHLENTIKRFTDDLHITANQTNLEEKLVKIREQRKKEEENYDNIIRRLQMRFLNRAMLDFKDALDKVEKIKNPKPFHPALIKQNPKLEGQLDKLDYNEYKKKLQDDVTEAKIAKGMFKEKNPKKLEGLQTRQDIFINKVETRLNMFEKVYNDPEGAKKKLDELKKQMLDLTPKNKETSGDESNQNLEKKVSDMATRLQNLENKVAACTACRN